MNYREISNYTNSFKDLSKKYRPYLNNGIDELRLMADSDKSFVNGKFTSKRFKSIKRRNSKVITKIKLACKLKGNPIRVIVGYDISSNTLTFIDIYDKGSRENEDRMAIKYYLEGLDI